MTTIENEFYPISHLIGDALHAMAYYHRTRCIFEQCDCINKMHQLIEFKGLFVGVN
jgi:hypothetical protein